MIYSGILVSMDSQKGDSVGTGGEAHKCDSCSHLTDSMHHVDGGDENIVDDNGSPVDVPNPDQEGLNKLREYIMKLSPDERREFMTYLASTRKVNPEQQRFSPASQEQIATEKMKRKMNKFKNQRTTKLAQKIKYERKMNAKKKYNDKLNGTAYTSHDDHDPIPTDEPSLLTPNPPDNNESAPQTPETVVSNDNEL